jgi:hypothetical protein
MFEELFDGPIARARQRESLLPEERRRFLSHLHTFGYTHASLRAIACELIVIATRLDLSGPDPLDAAVVEAAARPGPGIRFGTVTVRMPRSLYELFDIGRSSGAFWAGGRKRRRSRRSDLHGHFFTEK